MFKIPFSGNSKVIDLGQVTGLQGFLDFTIKIPKRIMSASLLKGSLFTLGQTIQKMHYILQEGREKKANILLVLGQ